MNNNVRTAVAVSTVLVITGATILRKRSRAKTQRNADIAALGGLSSKTSANQN